MTGLLIRERRGIFWTQRHGEETGESDVKEEKRKGDALRAREAQRLLAASRGWEMGQPPLSLQKEPTLPVC